MNKTIILAIILAAVGVSLGWFFWRYQRPVTEIYQGVAPLLRPAPALPPNDPVSGGGPSDNLGLNLPSEYLIHVFAREVSGARDLVFSPAGTLLVSLPGSGRVAALPDKDDDFRADEIKVIASGLTRPHGLAFAGNILLIAEENRLSRWYWDEESMSATFESKILDLPRGGRHTTRTIAVNDQGQVFVSLGSTCDTCFEKHPWIGTVITTNLLGESPRVYSSGLRNAVFITLHPSTGQLWGTEMGRDFLGDNLPPDEVNLLQDGQHYGWPVCYGDRVWDAQFGERTPEFCQNTQPPVFNIPAHSAPLGLAFINSAQFPADWQADLLVAYHGSWNRSVPTGYKIVRLKMGASPVQSEDFITGWISNGTVTGRPVDLEFSVDGSLFISDDRADAVYRVARR